MKNSVAFSVKVLKETLNKFDAESNHLRLNHLLLMQKNELPLTRLLVEYYDVLLFMMAYPSGSKQLEIAKKECARIAKFIKNQPTESITHLENEGLPFVQTTTRFTPDFLAWLTQHPHVNLSFDSFYQPNLTLNELFNITLPSLLQTETTAGLSNKDLLEVLAVPPTQYVSYLLAQLDELNQWPKLKDLLLVQIDLYVKLMPKNQLFSKAFNRLPVAHYFYHNSLVKKFDHMELLNNPLPSATRLTETEQADLIRVIKNTMALTARETDPTTYMQEDSLKLFRLERGISIAIYGMVPSRQLPLESYIGFTLFKNGFPVSYGGSWVFGSRTKFGMNVLESFRGGESGYVMCQILRVYKQVFHTTFFEVEPYQYGLDNPDGITSGAFWFYFRYGFRPLDKKLLVLANNEFNKIISQKNYRSSEKTLLQFTESNIGLNMAEKIPESVAHISVMVKNWISKSGRNNIKLAEENARNFLCKANKLNPSSLEKDALQSLTEFALWAVASKTQDLEKLKLMRKTAIARPKDVYAYQKLLRKLLN